MLSLAVSLAPQPPPRGFSEWARAVCLINLVVLVDFFFNSLEFRADWFSGASGFLLISDWLLFSFWLCEEAKGFYLHLHLGWNYLK